MNGELSIAPDYDPTEFAPLTLLEQGDVDMWVRRRGALLIEKSKETAKDCEASKLASVLTVGASVVMSSNPLAWLPLTIGAVGYVYTVFQEFQDTGSIRLVPMYRGKLGDILKVMEGGQATQRHPLEDQIEYLSEAEKDEALLINYRFAEIAGVLSSAPPKVRFDLYRHICGQFHARRDLLSGEEVQHYINTAVSEERRAMPAIQSGNPGLLPRPERQIESEPTQIQQPQVSRFSAPVSVQSNAPAHQPSVAVRSAYTLILDNPFQSLAVFGAQRTGKSYLIAILSQELHRRGVPIYAINLARFGEEDDAYWCHCAKSVMGDISSMKPYEANQLIKEAIRVVQEFYAQPNAILIFDEWAYAGNKDSAHAEALEPLLKLIADKLGTLTSTGIKRGKAIWTIAPEFVAGSLQKPALAIKKSALLYVTIAPGESVDWRGNRIGFNAELFSQIKNNYTIERPEGLFNQSRICYLNNEWIEMGELPPLDLTLRPATQPVATTIIQDPPRPSAAAQTDGEEAIKQMVELLKASRACTLWGFIREVYPEMSDLGEAKAFVLDLGRIIFEYELTSLKEKFRLNSLYDVRYSYPDYAKKVFEAHRATGNICCCCRTSQSKEIHHTSYQGIADQRGINFYPVCGGKGKGGCHDQYCHSDENWIVDPDDPVWGNRNTDKWVAKLNEGYDYLVAKQQAQ